MPRLPNKLSANSHEATTINQIIDYLASLTPKNSATVRRRHTPHGVVTEAAPAAVVKAGWDFSNPPEYDPETAYSPRQVVIVASSNPAVVDGVNGGADFAEPGKYVCVQPTGNTPGSIRPPKAEPDPATDGSGQWLGTVYWVQLAGAGNCPYG